MNDVTGKYSYNHQKNSMQIIDGPLHKASGQLIGFYTLKGSLTSGGGHTLETMIEFRKKTLQILLIKKWCCNVIVQNFKIVHSV